MIKENYIKLYETSFKDNWSLPALTNYSSGQTFSYADLARTVAKTHLLLKEIGITQDDKIALIAKDSAEWCMVYMGVITYGAIIVPILQDFHTNDILNIINHSDSTVVLTADPYIKNLDMEKLPNVHTVFDIVKFEVIKDLTTNSVALDLNIDELFNNKYPNGFTEDDIKYPDIPNDKVLLINYTSGTTGFSKGVILTANNLCGNVLFAYNTKLMRQGESTLAFLPNAHAYGCAFNFISSLQTGTHVYILGTAPVPRILLKAFQQIRPVLIISVPLILEKIYKNTILPEISKPAVKMMLNVPIMRKKVEKKICDKLYNALGGNFRQIIIGGAPLSDEVAHFMKRIGFPYTVGYGMTECAPLISYEKPDKYVPTSCGKIIPGMEIRIAPVPESHEEGVGEIQVRGENVCLGYYKNEKATDALFTEDGWMRTGDMASIDEKGNIFIKGRNKSMLLGPNGQNIYPEEIEAKLFLLNYVAESVVVQGDAGKVIALIYPDYDALRADGIIEKKEIEAKLEEVRKELNESLPAYERVVKFVIREEEFEKTPKKSIKRFLYN